MPAYTRGQPIGTDSLAISQPILQDNTDAADDVFGVDHFAFSNTTSVKGLHNTLTSPVYQNPIGTDSAIPPTSATYPIIFGFQDTAALGIYHYSIAPGSFVPTPITCLQSAKIPFALAATARVTVLDFSTFTYAYGIFTFTATQTGTSIIQTQSFYFDGTTFSISPYASFGLSFNAKVLQLFNNTLANASNIRWTLQFLRINI